MFGFVQVETDFEEQFADGKVVGWENHGQENEPQPQHSVIDLDYYTTAEELIEVGPEKLKEVMTMLHVYMIPEAFFR